MSLLTLSRSALAQGWLTSLSTLPGQGHLAKKLDSSLDHTLAQAVSRIVPLKVTCWGRDIINNFMYNRRKDINIIAINNECPYKNQDLWCLSRICTEFNGYYLTHSSKFNRRETDKNIQICYRIKKQNEEDSHTIMWNFSFHIIYTSLQNLSPLYTLLYFTYNTAVLTFLEYYQTYGKLLTYSF